MSDNRINHYYPAAIIAYGFSKEPQIDNLRESKVNVINVKKLITLLSSFKDSEKTDLKQFISDNETKFLYAKVVKEIFTSRKLKEPDDKEIQKIEQSFLKILQNGRFEENYEFSSKKTRGR